jgi:phage repressor protein C with HTH and peptisase S24 domain
MRTPSYIAVTLCALSVSVLSAPTPNAQLDLLNTVGSITSPGAGNDNIFENNGNSNGQNNGNGNSAGNNNGNDNVAGNENSAGNGNTFNLPSLTGLLGKEKRTPDVVRDLLSPITGTLTNTVGSITSPVAGSGNSFLGNGNNNGQGNGVSTSSSSAPSPSNHANMKFYRTTTQPEPTTATETLPETETRLATTTNST